MTPTIKGEKMLPTAGLTERKKTEQYRRKDQDRNQFQQNYRKYVSDPAKYEELKRQNLEIKAGRKANKLAV